MIDRWQQRNNELEKENFAHYLCDLKSYRTTESKFISSSNGGHEFYDIKNDPAESMNLYGSQDIRIENIERELENWVGSFTPHTVSHGTQPGFDKATWEKMKALGYA